MTVVAVIAAIWRAHIMCPAQPWDLLAALTSPP